MARVGSFRRGKVCQNCGGITGPREKRTRRLRDIDFIALATNFARVGFFHTKKNHGSARCCLLSTILRRFSKITAIVDGSRRLSTNRKRCRDPVFPPKRSFAQKRGRSSIRFRIIITILFPPSVVDPRNVRLKGELEMIEIERKFAILEITERGSEFFPPRFLRIGGIRTIALNLGNDGGLRRDSVECALNRRAEAVAAGEKKIYTREVGASLNGAPDS